jgi:hypothetical protein
MPLDNLFRRINALQKFDVERETIVIINEYGWYITDLLRAQLSAGKDSNDQPVTIFGRDYYSDRTVFDKTFGAYPPLGKITEWITNYRTGAFYSSLVTKANGRTFKIESDVPYFEDILKRSGDRIMKLNSEHLKQFVREILKPQLQARYKVFKGGV